MIIMANKIVEEFVYHLAIMIKHTIKNVMYVVFVEDYAAKNVLKLLL